MTTDVLASWAAPVAAWILTFALHGTCLLGAAWLITSTWRALPDAFAEVIWKSAGLGAVLTASCQLAFVGEPLAGHVAQVGESALAQQSTVTADTLDQALLLQPSAELPAAASAVITASRVAAGPIAMNWEQWLASLALLSAGFGSLFGFITGRSTRRLLRQRQPLRDGPAPALLGRLCARAGYWRGVRLSQHPDLQTPIAFGALRPEITLPSRAFADFDDRHQQSMLAHELGHLLHRDPLWLKINGLLVALFPWQPLLRLARRRLQILAEYRSDGFAAELTGNLAAASCLLEVASQVAVSKQPQLYAVTGMALRDSTLKLRIDRLLCGDLPKLLGRHRLWLLPLSTALLTVATTVLPGAELKQRDAWQDHRSEFHAPLQDSSIGLLGMLIMQLDAEFAGLNREIDLLREELADGPHDPDLTSMLVELDLKLASLERHRELFEEVLAEWSSLAEPSLDPDTGTRK